MSDIKEKARSVFSSLPPHVQQQHAAAWSRVEALVLSLQRKDARVFEVHHSLEHARGLYQTGLAAGFSADKIERDVRQAYTPS